MAKQSHHARVSVLLFVVLQILVLQCEPSSAFVAGLATLVRETTTTIIDPSRWKENKNKVEDSFVPKDTLSLKPRMRKTKSELLVEVAPANFPGDLAKIQECRRQAFPSSQKNLLKSQQSFINAEAAVAGRAECLVARERFPPFRILGTADLKCQRDEDGQIQSGLLQNVFVIPEARGQRIAQRLVECAEEQLRSPDDEDVNNNVPSTSKSVSLTVNTANTPAVTLYQRCSYEPKGMNRLVQKVGQTTGFPFVVTMTKEL